MNGYSFEKIFAKKHRLVWKKATELMEKVDDDLEEPLRCHEIARFVYFGCRLGFRNTTVDRRGKPIPRIVDGIYAGVQHSWIRLDDYTILDPYCVARIPLVQLVDVGTPTLIRNLYEPGEPRQDLLYKIVRELLDRHAPGTRPRQDDVSLPTQPTGRALAKAPRRRLDGPW